MIVLGVETSTSVGSVAIGRSVDGAFELLYHQSWARQSSHGELLTGAIESALQFCKISLEDVDLFAASVGPGSFTGIRIGLSAIKTLAYSTGKPVIPFNSLEILAEQLPLRSSDVLTLINAHKSQCYVAVFTPGKTRWKMARRPSAMTSKAIERLIKKKVICVGEGYSVFSQDFGRTTKSRLVRHSCFSDFPMASTLVRLAIEQFKTRKTMVWNSLEPLYIRGSEAEEKLKSGLLKPLPEL